MLENCLQLKTSYTPYCIDELVKFLAQINPRQKHDLSRWVLGLLAFIKLVQPIKPNIFFFSFIAPVLLTITVCSGQDNEWPFQERLMDNLFG